MSSSSSTIVAVPLKTPPVEPSVTPTPTPTPALPYPMMEPVQTNIDIFVYFDKYYTSITIFFFFLILLLLIYSYSSFVPVVLVIYIILMLLVFLYRRNQVPDNDKNETIIVPQEKPMVVRDEVFHIPSNIYTFEDAKAVCKAYDSRLATYAEIEEAYKQGADWCSYGWSEHQNAFFPTQQAHYDLLQKVPGHEHDCGRPGINGGYMQNPNLKLGVNCYGKKPSITANEEQYMAAYSPYPLTKEDMILDKKVSYLKNNLQNILISPFNPSSWNSPLLKI